MKKLMKKIYIILFVMIYISSISISSFATDLKTKLDIIKQSSETKYLEKDQGYVSKSIVESNPENGEVTIELKVSNTKKDIANLTDTEIILVIDNSGSMRFKTAEGKTRKSILLDSAKNFVNTIFNTSTNVKMGVVKFCGETGFLAPTNAASLITKPTNSKEDVLKGLTKIENKSTESGTNIQKGLMKAEESFSSSARNKVIILLTDGCPTEDGIKDENGKIHNVSDAQMILTNETYQEILKNTRNELVNIDKAGIKLISLMTGVNSDDVDASGNVITSTADDIEAIKTIFGTEGNPTSGKFYNAKTTNVSQVVQNEITKDVQEILNSPINEVKIVDYFPEDIKDNFEFSYVGEPSIGTTSETIDPQNSTITWDIGTLNGNEAATLKYKLKIKDMKNMQLLDKTIATNEKVILTYQDKDSKEYTVTLNDSPTIKLTEVKEEDNTKAPYAIPATGIKNIIVIAITIMSIITIVMLIRYNKYKDIK